MLNWKSQAQKTNTAWSHLRGIYTSSTQKNSRMMVARAGVANMGRCWSKSKVSVIYIIRFGYLTYNTVTIVNNIVLYTWNLLREQILSIRATIKKIRGSYIRWYMVIVSQCKLNIYQNTMLYTLNIYSSYWSIISQWSWGKTKRQGIFNKKHSK